MRSVHLIGDPPEVKILGEIIPDEMEPPPAMPSLMSPPASRDQQHKPLAPPPKPPMKGKKRD